MPKVGPPMRFSNYKPAVLEENNILELSKSDADTTDFSISSAIPGSHVCSTDTTEVLHWRAELPFTLPEQSILGGLVQQYFLSVNWFMHVIDEESFLEIVRDYTSAETVPRSKRNFMVLVYPSAPYDLRFLATFRDESCAYIETRMLSLMASPDLESVQAGILFGSFHLFNRLPNLGFGILGSTIETAQLLGLHRRFSRSASERDTYIKVWWALEIFEKYAAIAFGWPCGMDDADCEVPEIQASAIGTNNLTYHIEKCRLYRIIGTFLGRRKESMTPGQTGDIHERLRAWTHNLPTELRLEPGATIASVSGLQHMQALALQLAYDNIHIVIHRQAVFASGPKKPLPLGNASSIEQLIESALRTADTTRSTAMLPICRSSHAAMHAGICLFTAGVVLSALQLANIVSDRRDELLSGLERIIAFFKEFPGQHYHLASQCLEILQAVQLKCLNHASRQGSGALTSRDAELAESILAAEDFTSIGSLNDHANTADLLDLASGSSLQVVAQAWLWSSSLS
ncbi:hypothetical protein Slin15195_G045490 [Septoria linicola]|uniref:Xylanolytic transcriptional activator regulatory domain-containing protein n=1 Tax=Septoria linicola TaxID=215465 RepID=A0A9Q9ALK7_9PEZI|nr:hypothetical protein Slin14017_G049010 [Septoria linicola]USW51230.1 hypothetical protein Slin15195_G045490 [Septoria linicola]